MVTVKTVPTLSKASRVREHFKLLQSSAISAFGHYDKKLSFCLGPCLSVQRRCQIGAREHSSQSRPGSITTRWFHIMSGPWCCLIVQARTADAISITANPKLVWSGACPVPKVGSEAVLGFSRVRSFSRAPRCRDGSSSSTPRSQRRLDQIWTQSEHRETAWFIDGVANSVGESEAHEAFDPANKSVPRL